MITIEKNKISINGTGLELLQETLSIVYSIRKSMIQSGRVYFVEDLDKNPVGLSVGQKCSQVQSSYL